MTLRDELYNTFNSEKNFYDDKKIFPDWDKFIKEQGGDISEERLKHLIEEYKQKSKMSDGAEWKRKYELLNDTYDAFRRKYTRQSNHPNN